MAPSEAPSVTVPLGPPICGECGVVIGNVERHTAWHAGGADAESQGAVLDFLAAVNPDELERHMAAQPLSQTVGQAALAYLTALAGGRP